MKYTTASQRDTGVHLALCELRGTYRPTLAGLLLPSCLTVVSLLGGVWNSGTAQADVDRCSNVVFQNTVFKMSSVIIVIT